MVTGYWPQHLLNLNDLQHSGLDPCRLALTKYLRPSWTAKARTIGHADNRAGCIPGEAAAAVPRKSAAAIARATRPRRRACHVKPTCAGANGPSRSREWTRFEPQGAPADPHK